MARETRSQRLKRYRSLYAAAKRKGLVKGDKDARSFVPSSYMRTRLNKLAPYLNEDYAALKVAPRVARAYAEAPSDITPAVANGKVLVRNKPNYKALVRRGVPMRIRKLRSGEHEWVPLPIKATSPEDLEDVIKANPVFNQLKYEDELFAFKINGHPSYGMFPDLESLVFNLLKYENLDPDKVGDEEAENNFLSIEIYRSAKNNWKWDDYRLQERARKNREKNARSRQRRMARMTPEEKRRYQDDINERRKRSESYQRQVERQRQKRAQMTPEQKEEERRKARERMARRRAENREQ